MIACQSRRHPSANSFFAIIRQRLATDSRLIRAGSMPAAPGGDATAMARERRWLIATAPSEQLGSPRQVYVLAIGEEALVEELATERHVFEHRPPVDGGGPRCAEDVRRDEIATCDRQIA